MFLINIQFNKEVVLEVIMRIAFVVYETSLTTVCTIYIHVGVQLFEERTPQKPTSAKK